MPITHPHDTLPAPHIPHARPALRVEKLSFAYPDGHRALERVTLELQPGEKVAIVGPNGAGKSTLMLHLIGILHGEGRIVVGGTELDRKSLPNIRACLGMVFQNPDDQLFSPTVFDDVAFGPLHMGCTEDEVRHRVAEALEMVGMAGFADRLSHHLSVGEKKRIAIATVLSMKPEILVLDEPTAGLDPRARRSLIELLDRLPLTMLVSTHDMRLVKELFVRTIIMDQGKIVADGLTTTLLSDKSTIETHGLELP